MASRASFSNDSRLIKRTLPKTVLLRDYLLDDMSSCSSNGFRSYPRRQCCTTVVRFLVETDLNKNVKQHRRSIIENEMIVRSKFKPKQSSILQKASVAMINLFKHLKHGFWKKTDHHRDNEVKRWKSFAELLNEKEITPPPSPSPVSTAVATTAATELTNSTSNSDSWSGSDFTATTESFTAGNYSEVNLPKNDVVDELPEDKKLTNGNKVGTTTATATVTVTNYSDSTGNATKWQDKHNEQFSPVSVIDFPTDNNNDDDEEDEDEVSYVSQHKHLGVKGTKGSMNKTRVSARAPQLEPVKLEDRIAQSVLESSTTTFQENKIEKKAIALLQLMKSTVSSQHSLEYDVVESVLLGVFKETAVEENVSDYEMLQRAKDWMNGQEQEMFIHCQSENNKRAYLRDMEKGVKWSNYDHELEKVNISLEVECVIFSSLVNDVLTEFSL